jgi:ectoine hydroxylase-related dioxygenase (phytanoyl-CoA dioxygenase family)
MISEFDVSLLGPELFSAFWRDGVVIVRDVFTRPQIETLWAAVEDGGKRSEMVTQTPYGEGHLYVDRFLCATNRACRNAVSNPTLRRLASDLLELADELPIIFYDSMIVKHARYLKTTPWHRDIDALGIFDAKILSIWISFDDVDEINGALRFLTGSQRWDVKMPVRGFSGDDPLDGAISAFDAAAVPAGGVVIFDSRAVHGAFGNTSHKMRRALALRIVGQNARILRGKDLGRAPPSLRLNDGQRIGDNPGFPVL